MRKQQSGFTLIELIAVIVILGILAATAVPRFINLQDEAALAAVRGIAGGIESGAALNHAVDIAEEAGLTSDTFYTVATCADGIKLLSGGVMPNGFRIGNKKASDGVTAIDAVAGDPTAVIETTVVADKGTTVCTVVGSGDRVAEFVLIGAAGGS